MRASVKVEVVFHPECFWAEEALERADVRVAEFVTPEGGTLDDFATLVANCGAVLQGRFTFLVGVFLGTTPSLWVLRKLCNHSF